MKINKKDRGMATSFTELITTCTNCDFVPAGFQDRERSAVNQTAGDG